MIEWATNLALKVLTMVPKKGRYRISLGMGYGIKGSGIGTYLACRVELVNAGPQPLFFGGVRAVDARGEMYYPSIDLEGGTKLEAGQFMVGHIPADHLLKSGCQDLYFVDGLERQFRPRKKNMLDVLSRLDEESERLETLGYCPY